MRPEQHIAREIMNQMRSFDELHDPGENSWHISVPTFRIIQGLELARTQISNQEANDYMRELAKIFQFIGKWDAVLIRAHESGAIEFRTEYPPPRSEPEARMIDKLKEHDVAVFVLDRDKLLVDVRSATMEQTHWINDMFVRCGETQSHVIARRILSVAYNELQEIFSE